MTTQLTATATDPPTADVSETSAASGTWFTASGLAFVVLFVAAWFTQGIDIPDSDAPVSEWGDWITKDSTGVTAIVSVYLFVLAAIAFGVFAHGLSTRVRAARPERPSTASATLALGTAIAVLIATAGVAMNAGPAQFAMDNALEPPSDIASIVMISSIGYGLGLVAAMLAMALFIALVTSEMRAGSAAWFVALSWVCAAAVLGAVVFFPMIAVPVWVVSASFALRHRPTTR
jgi:hypothetical protein